MEHVFEHEQIGNAISKMAKHTFGQPIIDTDMKESSKRNRFCVTLGLFVNLSFGYTHRHVQIWFKLKFIAILFLDLDGHLECRKLACCRMHWKIYLMNVLHSL